MSTSESIKIAIVHDWLTGMRGGERCLEIFLRMYPNADLYTAIHIPNTTSEHIDQRVTGTSFLQRLPGIQKYYRWLLPLFPLVFRSLKLQEYDLIISLSHAGAKNVKKGARAKHICFCFTPMRYIWDQAERYFGKIKSFIFFPVIFMLRQWDIAGSKQVDQFVGISNFIAGRIRCYYKKEAVTLYPPINDYWLDHQSAGNKSVQAYLHVGALVPYKNVQQIIEAFNKSGETLWIVGDGPERSKLEALANENIRFFGRVSDKELYDLYEQCRALIFAAKEDFGLIPIEALATGTPVIAPYVAALKESVNNQKYWEENSNDLQGKTGIYFKYDEENLADEINKAVAYFKASEEKFSSTSCRLHAEKFRVSEFEDSWQNIVEQTLNT